MGGWRGIVCYPEPRVLTFLCTMLCCEPPAPGLRLRGSRWEKSAGTSVLWVNPEDAHSPSLPWCSLRPPCLTRAWETLSSAGGSMSRRGSYCHRRGWRVKRTMSNSLTISWANLALAFLFPGDRENLPFQRAPDYGKGVGHLSASRVLLRDREEAAGCTSGLHYQSPPGHKPLLATPKPLFPLSPAGAGPCCPSSQWPN